MLEELKHETKKGKSVLRSAKAEKPPPHLGLKRQKQEVCYYLQVRVTVPSSTIENENDAYNASLMGAVDM